MGGPIKVTFEIFKERFDAVYKGEYTLVSYEATTKPITFICPKHGEVSPKSGASWVVSRKQGCPMCAKDDRCVNSPIISHRVDRDTYQARFDEINQGRVTLTAYTSTAQSIEVMCATHGKQVIATATQALKMPTACPACSGKGAARDRMKKAVAEHFKTLAPGHVVYWDDKKVGKGNSSYYKMWCPIHGESHENATRLEARGCGGCTKDLKAWNRQKKAPNAQ